MTTCIFSRREWQLRQPMRPPRPEEDPEEMQMKEKKENRKRLRKVETKKKKKKKRANKAATVVAAATATATSPEEEGDSEETQIKEKEKRKKLTKLEMSTKKKRADESIKPIVKRVRPTRVQVGDRFDIPHLLSSSSPPRDYLIKSDQKQVKTFNIYGKYVLLLFYGLPDLCHLAHTPHSTNPIFLADLEDIYNTHKHEFEVVFVAFGDNKDVFVHAFSTMPWLAIPHEDDEARDFLQAKFGLPGTPCIINAVLFDPQGTVLQTDALSLIECVGPHGFPFTTQRIDEICCRQPLALWDQLVLRKEAPSLTTLVGDKIISPQGNEVPTSELEANEKIVGLYFFQLGPSGLRRTKKLLKIWKALKKNGGNKDFEIIFINATRDASDFFSEGDFVKKFRCTNPWYKLRFDGRELSRLLRLGHVEDLLDEGYLTVLKSDKYDPLSYFAFDVMQKFGCRAFPFTLEAAAKIAKRKQQKQLNLANLLTSSAELSLGAPGQEEYTTTVSKLSGKRVLLLFGAHSCYCSYLPTLMRMYNEQKAADDCFEIVYVSLDSEESQSDFHTSILEMPWFVYPFNPDNALLLVQVLFGYQFPLHRLPAVAAFGRDGYLETKESNLAFKKWNHSYPFIQADMTEEIHKEFINTYKWDLGRFHTTSTEE